MDNNTFELPQQERETPISRNNVFNYKPDSVETAQFPLITVKNPLEQLNIAAQGHQGGVTRVFVDLDRYYNVAMPAGMSSEDVEKLYNFIISGVHCEYLTIEEGNPEFGYLSIKDCLDLMIEHNKMVMEQRYGSSLQIAPYANIYIPVGLSESEIVDLAILLHRGVDIIKK